MTTFIDSSTSSQRTIHASSSIPTIQTYGSLWATTFPIQDDIVTVDKLLTTMPSICRGFCVTLGKHVAHIPGYPKSSTSSLTIVDTEASQSVAKALLTTTIPHNPSTLPDYILSEVSSLPCFMHAAVSRPAAPSTPVGVIHIYRNTDNTLRTICRPLSDDHACHTALDQKLAGDLVMLSGVIAAFTQSFIPLSPALLHHVTSMATQPPGQHSAARVLLEHGVTALSTIGATPPSTMISLLDRLASVTTGMDDHAASVSTYQSIIKNFADELVPHDVQRSGVTRLGTSASEVSRVHANRERPLPPFTHTSLTSQALTAISASLINALVSSRRRGTHIWRGCELFGTKSCSKMFRLFGSTCSCWRPRGWKWTARGAGEPIVRRELVKVFRSARHARKVAPPPPFVHAVFVVPSPFVHITDHE